MIKLIKLFILVLLVGCDSSPKIPQLSHEAVILTFGDSLTYGTGSSKGSSYPDVLGELLNATIVNSGIPGETSAEGLARLPTVIKKHKPDLMILIHGGNDILNKIPNQITADHLTRMIELAKQNNISVVMFGVPQPSLLMMESAEFYREVSNQTETPIDLYTLPQILGDSNLKSDTVHPNDNGYKLMAKAVRNLLKDSGAWKG